MSNIFVVQLQYLRNESGWVEGYLTGSRTWSCRNLLLLQQPIGLLSSQEFDYRRASNLTAKTKLKITVPQAQVIVIILIIKIIIFYSSATYKSWYITYWEYSITLLQYRNNVLDGRTVGIGPAALFSPKVLSGSVKVLVKIVVGWLVKNIGFNQAGKGAWRLDRGSAENLFAPPSKWQSPNS